MLVAFLKFIISVFMAVACTATAPFSLWTRSDYTPLDKENVKLTFATMSDIHLTDSSFRRMMLELGLADLNDSEYMLDALCLVGDNTDHGYIEQYENLKMAFSKYTPAKTINMVMGNHDTWTEDDGTKLAHEYYYKYNKEITGVDTDNVYFSRTINGYHIINICSEMDYTSAYISDEQLSWLDGELEKASRDNLPIFVFSHWPINNTHGLPGTWEIGVTEPMAGGLGLQSDAVDAILQKYQNVFYITGHVHSGFTNDFTGNIYKYNSVEKHGNITCVNLPCYMYFSYKGVVVDGTGYVFEVYDNKVEIRARNYIAGCWLNKYNYTIELTK